MRHEIFCYRSGVTMINSTPHAITILDADHKEIIRFDPSGHPIRLEQITVPANPIENIPTSLTLYQAGHCPDPEENVFHIVSQLVKNAYPQRTDFLVPAEIVRDSNNNILGCRSLGR